MATLEPGDVIAIDGDELTAVPCSPGGGRRRPPGRRAARGVALFAEDRGKSAVGVAHLLDCIDAMADGRLDGRAVPAIAHRVRAVITSDARRGIAHIGFDESFADLAQAARRCGLAAFAQQNAFTCGQLGWFTERLADAGLVAVATAVSPAVLAAAPGTGRVFGTNPMARSPRLRRRVRAVHPPIALMPLSSWAHGLTHRRKHRSNLTEVSARWRPDISPDRNSAGNRLPGAAAPYAAFGRGGATRWRLSPRS